MKNTYSIAQRNAIVEEHLYCIDDIISQNNLLIRAVHLDREDIYQNLAVRLINAVISFDPKRDNLEQHIYAQLIDELRCCRQPQRLYGITGVPAGERVLCFSEG